MVITLTVASETDRTFQNDGENRYFISQGKTILSANKNVYKYLCKEYKFFKFESSSEDVANILYLKFSRWQEGKDTWKDKESWTNKFSEFSFPRHNRAEVVEVTQKMYEATIAEIS